MLVSDRIGASSYYSLEPFIQMNSATKNASAESVFPRVAVAPCSRQKCRLLLATKSITTAFA